MLQTLSTRIVFLASALTMTSMVMAADSKSRAGEAEFREVYKELVETNTALSNGSCTLAAERMAARLKSAGLEQVQVFTAPGHPKEGGLFAVYPGSDSKAKAILLLAHIDVVEAKREDWTRDPFVLVEENGSFYARGAMDDKAEAAIWVDTLMRYAREKFKPRRAIKIALTCGEETAGAFNGAQWLAQNHRDWIDAEFAINEGAWGEMDEHGVKLVMNVQAGEKAAQNFRLEVTNPGGHSSQPRKDNAIDELAAALLKIADYRFTPELSDLTKAYFQAAAKYEDPQVAGAMRAFAANPADAKAIATLSAKPDQVGKIGTTCVVTMINGGHALNALPQRAGANVNCRIFPGHPPAAIMAELARAVANPNVTFKDVTEGTVPTDASPMRPDFIAAVTDAMAAAYPGVPVFPSMASGASDSMWFRSHGVPSYGASPTFLKPSDDFSHGLNERMPVANIAPGINYYLLVLRALSK